MSNKNNGQQTPQNPPVISETEKALTAKIAALEPVAVEAEALKAGNAELTAKIAALEAEIEKAKVVPPESTETIKKEGEVSFIGNTTKSKIILQPQTAQIVVEPMGYATVSDKDVAGIKASRSGQAMLDRGALVLSQTKKPLAPTAGKLMEKKAPEDVPAQKVKGGTVSKVDAKLVTK